MPKQKTRKAAAKRFRITRTGKVRRRQAKTRHLLERKNSKKKRSLGKTKGVAKADIARVKYMLPGG